MSERFFSAAPITTERATLDGPEAHHLLHVMRAKVGYRLTLFDDSGAEFTAVVDALGRSEVTVRVLERRHTDRELPFPLTLGVALPKGDRQKWLVEKLTELGVTSLVPLATDRGVAQPTSGALERLRRMVIEAAKQCGRNRLMKIENPCSWSEWVESDHVLNEQSATRNPQSDVPPRRLLAHPGGTPIAQFNLTAPHATQFAVGPEGGLTDDEVAAATAAGWQTLDLGPRILRVETAAVALAAVLSVR